MKIKTQLLIILFLFMGIYKSYAQKPYVWIYSDMSDKSLPGPNREGTINDPDDISAMAGYLLMCNEFNTIGIVISSTHRKEHKNTPNQADWANKYFGDAYCSEVSNLNKNIGGYPPDIKFLQSCIKESAEKFNPQDSYSIISKYSTVKALYDVVDTLNDTINVLCWCSLTEPAILVRHCLTIGRRDILRKIKFIAHWTNSPLHQGSFKHPENVANCREDAFACKYMKEKALARDIDYYECGAIGQHGIVSGAPEGKKYYDQFRVSKLGTIFVDGKFENDRVDHSDSATYWVLLGKWGVSLKDIKPDGTNTAAIEQRNENKFKEWSKRIHDELLRRAKAVTN